MINRKIFKTEFLRLDNNTFEKKYRLFDKRLCDDLTRDINGLVEFLSNGTVFIEDLPKDKIEKLKEWVN